jgi:riboflavin kinase/FMN adenylyltransferase
LVPGSGVYATRVQLGDGVPHQAVVNIGNRPTFGGSKSVVEAHLLDFSGDLYGRRMEVDFVTRLRSERKYTGIDELVEAIGKDVVAARRSLEG